MRFTGKILVLAYPDTFVRMSNEWLCKLLPLVGLGTKEYIKAGHAALILIENRSGIAKYYDFGRYVTPDGFGRVRSAITDAELNIPFYANITLDGSISNIEDFLIWLDKNPDKTHGEGRLIASLCANIDYKKAENYILDLQNRGNIPYGAFNRDGSNCSRFVANTILSSTGNNSIIKGLKWNKLFTPSAIGNVEKSSESKIYKIQHGELSTYEGSAFKENLKNYFHRKKENSFSQKTFPIIPASAQKLAGIGSNAWFELMDEYLPNNQFRIRRYNDLHQVDFDSVYRTEEYFDPEDEYQFVYESNCKQCMIIQNKRLIKFNYVMFFSELNSMQKVHSA